MNSDVRNLLKRTRGLGWGYRFFWRLQYTMLGIFGPPDAGVSGGPRGQLVAERRARVERLAAEGQPSDQHHQ